MLKVISVLAFLSVALATEKPEFLQANHVGEGEYYVSLFALQYIQAYATCKRYGWSLASERNSEETDAINETLKNLGATSDYWLSGFYQNDGQFNAVWIWLNSGEEFNYTNWRNGEPTSEDNCLARETQGKWLAYDCNNKYNFICRKE